ncbi:MAG: hypothetical protein AAGG02_15645 [Cyanobacteria bacterium P01_H01_bin.15]
MPQGPGFAFTFLYYFSLSAFITILVTVQGTNFSWQDGFPYQVGTLLGLIAATFSATSNRSTTIVIPFVGRKKFSYQLEQALEDMGFKHCEPRESALTVYRKSAVRSLFSGQIYVQLDEKKATIHGRVRNLKRLQKIVVPSTND